MFDFKDYCHVMPPEQRVCHDHVRKEPPRYTMTEEMEFTMRHMRETIDRLLRFEERVGTKVDDIIRQITNDNVIFKGSMNTTWTAFLNEVKNEINTFESDMENARQLFETGVDDKYSTLKSETAEQIAGALRSFNDAFTSFQTALNTRLDENNATHEQAFADYRTKLTTELNTFERNINTTVTAFKESVNTTISTFTDTWSQIVEERLNEQDAKIDDAELYMRTNLHASLATMIGDMKDNGEFNEILENEVLPDLGVKVDVVPVNVRLYGVMGDGVTDDTLAIKSALESADCLYFPKGTYIVSETLNIDTHKHLIGSGNETIIKYTGADTLFVVETDYQNPAIIESIYFEGAENSYMNVSRETWGASVIVNNCHVESFNANVFIFKSAFNCIIENSDIYSNGKITFTTLDGSVENNNFCNCNTFRNVYVSAYEKTPIMFDLINTKQLTFKNCQFEGSSLLLNGGEGTSHVALYGCWIEDVDCLFNFAKGTPILHECNLVRVLKYNYKSTTHDYVEGLSIVNTADVSTDTLKAMGSGDNVVVDYKDFYHPTGGYTNYVPVYKFGTKDSEINSRVNAMKVKSVDGTSFSANLQNLIRWTNTPIKFNVSTMAFYNDGSFIIYEATIVKLQGAYKVGMLRKTGESTWEGATANNIECDISVVEGVLTFTSPSPLNTESFMYVNYEVVGE